MSKDIWHITNQDENTTDVPEEESFVVLIGNWTSCLWYGGETPEPIFWKNVKRWCYLDDLLALETKLERTRKALGIAVDALKELRPTEKKSCYLVPTVFTTQRIIDEALEQITALEQKDK